MVGLLRVHLRREPRRAAASERRGANDLLRFMVQLLGENDIVDTRVLRGHICSWTPTPNCLKLGCTASKRVSL